MDGLLLTSPLASDACLRELAELVPVVVTNRLVDDVPAVLTESAEATGHAVEHLHALGHRDIAYLAGPDGYSNDPPDSPACKAACDRLGLRPVVLGPFPARFSSGVRAADLVLAAGATAVVAFNDDIAAGLLNRFADRGVRVPDHVSVVGHDDTALAEMVTPRLTTVHIPAGAAGATATQLLITHVRGDDGSAPPVRARVGVDRARQYRTRAGPTGLTSGRLRTPQLCSRSHNRCRIRTFRSTIEPIWYATCAIRRFLRLKSRRGHCVTEEWMAGNSNEPGRTVTSKLAAILVAFTNGRDYTLSELAMQTNLAVSTVHRLLSDLVRTSLIERPDGCTYRPGPTLRELPYVVKPPTLRERAPFVVEDLAASLHTTARLGVVDGLEVAYVEKKPGPEPGTLFPNPARLPLHATAIGKVLLAFGSRSLVRVLGGCDLPRYTTRTARRPDRSRGRRSRGPGPTASPSRTASSTRVPVPSPYPCSTSTGGRSPPSRWR